MKRRARAISWKALILIFIFNFSFLTIYVPAYAVRIKDISTIEGVRENLLFGYGLVIGLKGTGDKSGTAFTVQSLSSMLRKMGITVDPKSVKVKNVAAVMVTAELPPFVRPGSRIDVVVSSMGDAASLQGGTLLLVPLKGGDQQVYAVAQGPISIGGFSGGEEGDTVQKNHPTVGRIPSGALVEKEVEVRFADNDSVAILLRQQDFTTAMRVSRTINQAMGQDGAARAVDSGMIRIQVPGEYKGRIVEFISSIERLNVNVDLPAKVVVNERTGTIVMGDKVRISNVAVSHGNLTIRIQTDYGVSQPLPFSPRGSETVIIPQRETTVIEEDARISVLQEGTSLGEVVRGLNALGVTPRDLIAILQAMRAAGALQAEMELL